MAVAAADIDLDGDMDVLTASKEDGRVVWYKNTDGKGTFGVGQDLRPKGGAAKMVFVADLDGDGDEDVLSATGYDNRVTWYENKDGQGTFESGVDLDCNATGASDVHAADLDGDGDLDVISAASGANRIAWYENIDGNGTFSARVDIDTVNRVSSVVAADLDNDGDMDLVCCSAIVDDPRIVWYENTDGEGDFSPSEDVPITDESYTECTVVAADLDGDGDLDILAVFLYNDTVVWYENLLPSGSSNSSTSAPAITLTPPPLFEEDSTPSPTITVPPSLSPTSSYDVTGEFCRVPTVCTEMDGGYRVHPRRIIVSCQETPDGCSSTKLGPIFASSTKLGPLVAWT